MCVCVGGQCWWLLRLFEAGFSFSFEKRQKVGQTVLSWQCFGLGTMTVSAVMARSWSPFDTTVA